MNNVVCECGQTVKGESALAQHKRDSPKHRQSVEPAGTSDPSLSRRRVSNTSSNGLGPFYSRYPPIQFVRAGESIKHNGKKGKGRFGTKLTRGPVPEMPQLRVNEYGKPYMSGLDDEDWSLCDKDCAWCGHCADGVGF
ncbi:hypothetical protein FVER14953_20299 [Fusarium verticillioides]|nr:hypothetical protein FVER14953_20299 [Fusarium verticillioides]